MSSSLSLLRPIGRTDGHKRNNNNTTRLAGSSGSGAVVNYRHVSLVFHRVLFSFSSSSSAVQQQQQQNDALHLESSTIIRRTARHKYHRDRNDTLLLLFYPLLDSRTLIVLHPFSFFSLKEPKTWTHPPRETRRDAQVIELGSPQRNSRFISYYTSNCY